jgi:hypothetical protein
MFIKNRFLHSILVIGSLLFLCACPYESEFPLSKCSKAVIDKQLIGQWRLEPKDGEEGGIITIYRFNDHEYLISARGEEETTEMVMRAFGTRVDGQTFLNVQIINKPGEQKRPWHLVHYALSENKLVYNVVEDDLFKEKQFNSSAELYTFVKKNLKQKELYDQDGERTLTKILKQTDSQGTSSISS